MEKSGEKVPILLKSKNGKQRQKRIVRCESVSEVFERIKRQFSITDEFTLTAKIAGKEFDIDTEDDVDELFEAEELIVYPKEVDRNERPFSRFENELVRVGDEEFPLDSVPRPDSTLVLRHCQDLIPNLAIPSMVFELRKVKGFLYMAYYGARNSAHVQIKVQDVGYTIATLCEKSKRLLRMTSSKSRDIIEKLRDAFRYLFNGREDLAVLNFKDIARISESMKTESCELKMLFDEGIEAAREGLEKTQYERSNSEEMSLSHALQRLEISKDQEFRGEELVRFEELVTVTKEEVEEKKNLQEKAFAREKRAQITKSRGVVQALSEFAGCQKSEDESVVREKEFKKAIESNREAVRRKLTLSDETANCRKQLELLEEKEGKVEKALAALHDAITGMKGLSHILYLTGEMFASMSDVMDDMFRRNDSLKEKITMGDRVPLIQSETFKVEAFNYLSKWVAVEDICSSQKIDMEEITNGLHNFLKDNPTREEAERQMSLICAELECHSLEQKSKDQQLRVALPPLHPKKDVAMLSKMPALPPSYPQSTNNAASRCMTCQVHALPQRDPQNTINGATCMTSKIHALPSCDPQSTNNGLMTSLIPATYTNLYVKHIREDVDDQELTEMFQEFGPIVSARVALGHQGKYGFVNFGSSEAARNAVNEMHGKLFLEKELYVQPFQSKRMRQQALRDKYKPCENANVYIKNLEVSIDEERLRFEFGRFGQITSVKVERDEVGITKGFGFVCYSSPSEASAAITEMNGVLLDNKAIYATLAQRKGERVSGLTAEFAPTSASGICSSMPSLSPLARPYTPPNQPVIPGSGSSTFGSAYSASPVVSSGLTDSRRPFSGPYSRHQ